MTDDQKTSNPEEKKGVTVERTFDNPPTAPTFFSDYVQVTSTGNEVYMQFYATVPYPPGQQKVVTRLQATVAMTPLLASRILDILKSHAQGAKS